MIKKTRRILAISILVLALGVLAGRVAITHLMQQTHYFEQVATQALGYEVTIQHVSVRWRGFYPLFVLQDVLVKNDKQALIRVNRLNIGVNFPASLWHRKFIPGTLEVSGASIAIFQDEMGHWQIAGVSGANQSKSTEFNDWLEWLLSEREILLSDIQIQYKKTATQTIPIAIDRLQLFTLGSSVRIQGDVGFLQPQPGAIHLIAKIHQSFRADSLRAKIYLQASNVDLAVWLSQLPFSDWQVTKGTADAKVWAIWENKQWQTIESVFSAKQVALKRAQQTLSLELQPLHLFWKQLSRNVWQCQGLSSAIKINKNILIKEPLSFLYQQSNTQKQLQISQLTFNLVDELVKEISYFPKERVQLINKIDPQGMLENLYLKLEGDAWLVDGDIVDASFEADDKIPGAKHLSGHLQSTPQGGFFELNSKNLVLDFPKVFRQVIPLEKAEATAYWQLLPAGFLVQVSHAQAQNGDGLCYGQFSLLFNNQETHPWMSLVGGGQLASLDNEARYLPFTVMPKKVVDWVDQAIVPGKGKADAAVVINGPMVNFPFDKNEGQFIVDANLDNIDLQFEKTWPHIKDIIGNIVFHNREMVFQSGTAKIFSETTLDRLQASIPYMGPDYPAVLNVSGNAKTNMREALQYIQGSPLNEIFKQRFNRMEGEGPLSLQLQLGLPLSEENDPVMVTGNLIFAEDKLGLPDFYISDLTGNLQFTENGMRSPALTGMLLDKPIKINMTDTLHPDWSQTQINIQSAFSVSALEKLIPTFPVKNYFSGGSQFDAVMNIYHAKPSATPPPDQLELHTDLKGLGIQLPYPFEKAQSVAQPAVLKVQWLASGPVIQFTDGNETQGIVALNGKNNQFDRGMIAVNLPSASLPAQPGLVIAGQLDTFDWPLWQTFLAKANPKKEAKQPTFALPDFLKKIDLTVGKLTILDREWVDTRLQLAEAGDELFLQIKNQFISGKIFFVNGLKQLRIRLDYLFLPESTHSKNNFSPDKIPNIDFYSESVKLGNKNFGRTTLIVTPIPQGISIAKLLVDAGSYQLNATGHWTRVAGEETSTLLGNLSSQNLSGMLQDWGLAPGITSNQAAMSFSLDWEGSPFDLDVRTLDGHMDLNIKNGVVTDVGSSANLKIGLGRIITLLSVQSLQQKLQLNFNDLTNKGFNFSILTGQFMLENGQAVTQQVVLEGSVAKVKISGRIGLATHDYDLDVWVTPHVTSSLPVIATIAGGPVVGAITWLTDKVLSAAVQKLTTYHYHVTGPWTTPTIAPR